MDIAYQVTGEGPFDLLLFSGSSIPIECVDDEPSMARFQRRLASFSRVIRFDRRGIGLSDRGSPTALPSHKDWVQDTLAVLDALGTQQAAIFAPFTGTVEGIMLAAMYAERVSRLVVVNGAARATWAPDYPAGIPQEVADAALASAGDPDAVEHGYDDLATFAPSVASNPAFRNWWDRSGNLGATPAMARWLVNLTLTVDIRALLPRVQVPTLILHRTNMEIFDVEHGRYLARHIPGSRYVELPGADILYWVGDTGPMLDEVEEFLTGTRGGSGSERVLATVLFTDIVGSTTRAAQLGDDRWRDLLDRHDQNVRAEIERFRGREVKTVGDGFLATFDSPGRAIECALGHPRDTGHARRRRSGRYPYRGDRGPGR